MTEKMGKKLYSTIFLICMLAKSNAECNPSKTTASGTHAPKGQICSGDLIFEDNFDTLDLQKWHHVRSLGNWNGEFQWYDNSRSNSYVENGHLFIKPTLLANETGEEFLYSGKLTITGGAPADVCTDPSNNGCERTGTKDHILNPVKSVRIRTVNSFSFKFGKLEVRAKLPAGDWLWPAIWMRSRYNQYAGWPASGEIDLMESRGNRHLTDTRGHNIGTQRFGSTLHWGPRYDFNKWRFTHWEKTNNSGFDTDFHKYQMEWTTDSIAFKLDDHEMGTVTPPEGGFWELGGLDQSKLDNPWKRNSKMAPFDQEFYLILNVAIGSTKGYFPDNARNPGGKPWSNKSPTAMTDFWEGRDQWLPTWQLDTDSSAFQVDYVRVWAL